MATLIIGRMIFFVGLVGFFWTACIVGWTFAYFRQPDYADLMLGSVFHTAEDIKKGSPNTILQLKE